MAYVVLARKYRPQRFADLVGQEHVTRTLANAISHDRVHHAYLFCGARGLGKTSAARILAKCLVCERGPAPEPCNECRECTAVNNGSSVDVIEIDGASNNRVDDIRNLREQVRYLPQSARKKIYIVDEVHMLTGSAFNALLKTLEEPPPHVTFILATTEVHELPATILSRVSRFDFRRVASGQLVAHAQRILEREGVQIEEAGLYTIARAGDGSVRDTLTLLDKIIAFASDTGAVSEREVRTVLGVPARIAVAELTDAVLARDAEKTLRLFDEVVESGQDLQQLALAFLQHIRDLVVVKACGARDVVRDMSDSQFEQLQRQAEQSSAELLSQLFDRFARTVDALPRTRVPRLIMEMGLLDLVHSDPLIPLGDLVERLDRVASGRGPGPGGSGMGNAIPRGSSQRGGPAPQRGPSFGDANQRSRPAWQDAVPAGPPPRTRPPQANDTKSKLWRILGGGQDRAPQFPEQAGPGPSQPRRPPPPEPTQTRTAPPTPPPQQPRPREASRPSQPSARTNAGHGRAPARANTGADDELPASTGPRRPPVPEEKWDETAEFSAWESFIQHVSGKDTPLTAMLGDCGLISFNREHVQLVTPRGGMRRRQLSAGSEMYGTFERALHEYFFQAHAQQGDQQQKDDSPEQDAQAPSAAIKIELREDEPKLPDLPSLTLVRRFRARALQRQVEREAAEAPEIRRLLSAFRGTIRSVKPLCSP